MELRVTRIEGASPSADELAILRLINRWIVYRDSGDWERLRAVWHEDGTMTAGWRQGPADDFIAASKAGWDDGRLKVMHELGAIEVEVMGDRAISQNKITITVRADVEGTLCDVTCMGRHFDRWDKRKGLWGLIARQTIYDRDRLDTVVPGEVPALDLALLNSYGEAYRHLAYVFASLGYGISREHPALRTPEGDALVSEWRAWLR
jgi:hypothetical protein